MRHIGDAAVSAVIGRLGGHEGGEFAQHGGVGLNNAITLSVDLFRLQASRWLSPEGIEAKIAIGMRDIQKAIAICESPIESAIVPWLVFSNWDPLAAPPVAVHIIGGGEPFPEKALVIIPQMKFANARFDFVLYVRDIGVRRMIAIECDGQEYHDAMKDMNRDDYFASWGIPTVRLTGALINKGPQRAVERVMRAVETIQPRALPQ